MLKRIFFTVLCLILLSLPALTIGQEKEVEIEPKADKILRQMSEYLSKVDTFSFHTENTTDVMVTSALKLQFADSGDISVSRPDKMKAEIDGDLRNQEVYYDGKSFTIFHKQYKFYAAIEVSSELNTALDKALDSFELDAPLADIIYTNSYDVLTKEAQSGIYVGLHTVHGIPCHHLSFTQEEIDWQIWIDSRGTPLPRKFIVTSKWVTGAPQFTAILSDWNTSATFEDSFFTFTAPEGAEKIDFISADKSFNPKKKILRGEP